MGYSNVAGDLNVYASTSTESLTVKKDTILLGNLTVNYGTTNLTNVVASNLTVTGNFSVTATNTQVTNALSINNYGTATAFKVVQFESGGSGHTHNVAEFWDWQTLAMCIDPEGNVAIHTGSSPGYALTVKDGALFDNLTSSYFIGDGSNITSIQAVQIYGGLSAGQLQTHQSNITTVGTLTSLTVNGPIVSAGGNTLSNLNASNVTIGAFASNQLQTAQGNITSVGTLTSVNVGSVSNTSYLEVTGWANIQTANFVTANIANIYTTNIVGFIGSQWVGEIGFPIYYESNVGIGSTTFATSNLEVTGNIYASNAITTPTLIASTIYGPIAGSNTIAASTIYGPIAGSNTIAASTVKATTVSGTTLYGPIAGSNTIAASTIYGPIAGSNTISASTIYGAIAGSNTIAASTIYGPIAGSNTISASTIYGAIAGSNTIAASTISGTTLYGAIAGSNTIAASTISGTTLYGAIAGSNAISASTIYGAIAGSNTIVASTISGTTLYGAIAGSNTIAASTISGTTLYGAIAGSNTIAASTISGTSISGTTLYGAIAGSNTIAASTISGTSISGTTLYGAIAGSNTISASTIYGPIAGSNTIAASTISGTSISGTTLYGAIAGSNTIAASTIYGPIAGSNTIAGSTIAASTLYGAIAGSNTIAGSTISGTTLYGPIAGSNTIAASTISGTTLYGAIAGSNTIAASTISGTTLYGAIAGSNTIAASTIYGAIAGSNTIAASTISGTSISGTTLYGAIAGSNTIAASTISGTTLYGPIAGSNTIAASTISGTTLYGPIAGSNAIAASTISGTTLYGAIAGSNTIAASTIYGPIAGSNTIAASTIAASTLYGAIAGSNTIAASTISGTTLYGAIAGSNAIAASTIYGPIAGSNTIAASTIAGTSISGTTLYGPIAGSNAIAASTISGTTLYAEIAGSNAIAASTISGTTLYGPIAGSNTIAASTISGTTLYGAIAGSNTIAASTISGTTLYGAIAGSNTISASTLSLGTALSIGNGGTGQTSAGNAFNALSPMTTLGDLIYGGSAGGGTRLPGSTTALMTVLTQTGTGAVSAAPSWTSTTGTGSVVLASGPTLSGTTTISTLNLTNALGILYGGTGQTTASAGITALTGTQASGKYLRSDGANATLSTLDMGDAGAGTLAIARGGTASATAASAITALTGTQTSGKYLRSDGANSALSTLSMDDAGAGTLAILRGGTGSTTATGTGSVVLASGPTLSGTTTISTLNLTNALGILYGGTGQTTAAAGFNALSPVTTLGDLIYGSGTNASSRLAGNTTTTKNFLVQTGTGSVSAAPSWSALQSGDIPNNAANTTGSSGSCTGNSSTATTATNQSGGTVSATTVSATTSYTRTPASTTAAFQAAGASLVNTSYNLILTAANDTLNRLVLFVNGSTRTADGGASNVIMRNDGGSLILGNTSYPTILYGNVGIGTASAPNVLDIRGGNIGLGSHLTDNGVRFVGIYDANNPTTSCLGGMEIQNTTLGGSWSQKVHFKTHYYGVSTGRRMTINESGSVGIGTESPAKPLHVWGGMLIGASSDNRATTVTLNAPGATVTFSPNNDIGDGARIMCLQCPDLSSTTANLVSFSLQVAPTGSFGTQRTSLDLKAFRVASASYGGFCITSPFDVGGSYDLLYTDRTKAYFQQNLGIGTNSPQFRLNSAQDISLTTDIAPNTAQFAVMGVTDNTKRMVFGYDTQSAGNGYGFIKAGKYNTAWTNISLQPTGGNVGIGITNPSFKLQVTNGDSSFSYYGPNTTWGAYLLIGAGTNNRAAGRAQIISSNGNLHMDSGTGQIIYLNYYSAGDGVGAETRAYGPLNVTGDITAFYSDERLKTKVGSIENPLDKVCSLSAFKYVHNDIAKSVGFEGDGIQVGLSAQEVKKILPEVVARAPFDEGTVYDVGVGKSKSGQEYLTLKYERLVPLLVEALKEERAERLKVDERLARLEKLLLKE